PRRITWQSGLPAVNKIDDCPVLEWPRNVCGWAAETIASIAIWTLPEVPFLNPTGHDSPEASCRCTWLSVVRAPIAPQLTSEATYCGEIMSRNSVPAGIPISATSSSKYL